jgi:uncharacterized protein YdcH (DUF465 family)
MGSQNVILKKNHQQNNVTNIVFNLGQGVGPMELTNELTNATAKPQLAQLKAEHNELEKRLAEINSHLSLTAEEQLEKKQIQKLKLQKKDQIAALESRDH